MNFFNKLLMSLSGLLEDQTNTSNTDPNAAAYAEFPWLKNIVDVLQKIVGPILIVVGAVGIIYAIYLGVMLAKAENAEKREEAKKRIINVVVAIAITAALIFLMYLFTNNLDWFITDIKKDAVIGLLKMK